MEEKRLTYYQICSLVAQKQPVPDSYNIKYYCDLMPRKIIDETVDTSAVTFHRNTFPMPDQVKVCGEQIVVVPQPRYDDDITNPEDDLVDFGDVYIQTEFYLTSLNFKYRPERGEEVSHKLNELTDSMYGYVLRKQDYTFDMDIKLLNETLSIKNAMPTSATYGEISYDQNADNMTTVEFSYDYFQRIPNKGTQKRHPLL